MKRNSRRLIGHASEATSAAVSADFHHIDQIATRHFKHTLLLAWLKVTRRSKRDLGDRWAVLRTLYHRRLRNDAFVIWHASSVSRIRWRRTGATRGFQSLRRTRLRKKRSRYALRRGIDFCLFKLQLVALKRFYKNAKRSQHLRQRFLSVLHKHQSRIVVRAMGQWTRLMKSEDSRRDLEARAMGLFIFHMTRRTWNAWCRWHVGEREGRRVRRALAAAEVDRERRKEGDVVSSKTIRHDNIPSHKPPTIDRTREIEDSLTLDKEELLRISLSGDLLTSLLEREETKVGIDSVSDDETEMDNSENSSLDGEYASLATRHAAPVLRPVGSSKKAPLESRIAMTRRLAGRGHAEQVAARPINPVAHTAVRRVKARAFLSW